MLSSIEIKNFRCFDSLKASGFERLNLISGKNNIGKTALLEAIFLNSAPRPDTIFLLRQVRREHDRFSQALPERTWSNFFFQQNKDYPVLIEVTFEKGDSKRLEVCVDESVKDFFGDTYQKGSEQEEEDKLISLLSGEGSVVSVLHLKTIIDRGDVFETLIIANAKGLIARDIKVSDTKSVSFIPSSFLRISNRYLVEEFDKARLKERDDEVLNAFKAIDPSIEKVESFSIGEPNIYLTRVGENRLPLALFGDAMNRVADIILKIVNNENSILLIDEVENGIHHTNQVHFWTFLYKLAHELNVQIFATTHSLEMTKAFIQAGLEYSDLAAHFELIKQAKTGRIVAIKRDLETLDYGISHNKEVRGG